MRNYQPTYRWKLTDNQLLLFEYFHKFRFLTTDLLAEVINKDRSTVYERLNVLVQQGYLLKQYENTYRIDRRPATYCLAPLGIRILRTIDIEQMSLNQHYKNKSFTAQQIDDCLLVVRMYLRLHKLYSKNFNIYTKYQIDRDPFPRPTPALVMLNTGQSGPDYFIDLIPAGMPTWQIKKRLYMHENSADDIEATYPNVVFVTGNSNTEKRIIDFTSELYNDFKVYTTTLERLLTAEKPDIFTNSEDYLGLDDTDEKPKCIALPTVFED